MTTLDELRARAQLARRVRRGHDRDLADGHLGQPLDDAVSGFRAREDRRPQRRTRSSATATWLEDEFLTTVQNRGAEVIKAARRFVGRVRRQRRDRRRLQPDPRHAGRASITRSAAARTASTAWTPGLIFSFPSRTENGVSRIVDGHRARRVRAAQACGDARGAAQGARGRGRAGIDPREVARHDRYPEGSLGTRAHPRERGVGGRRLHGRQRLVLSLYPAAWRARLAAFARRSGGR